MEKIENKIVYRKGNMFHAPIGSVLLHACNCQGRWGSGVALQMRDRFPKAWREYQVDCEMNGKILLGSVMGYEDSGYLVTCMFTSLGYGVNVDAPKKILESTKKCLDDFLPFTDILTAKIQIHSPKINSGLFNVPWEHTEALINAWLVKKPTVSWTVWDGKK